MLLEPFTLAAPPSARRLFDEAAQGRGPLAFLKDGRLLGRHLALLRGHPPLPSVELGWAIGACFFVELDAHALPLLEREQRGCTAHVLDALAAGLAAGLPGTPELWKTLERLVEVMPRETSHARVPEAIQKVLPMGLVDASAVTRGIALKLCRTSDAPARSAVARAHAAATGKARSLLGQALEVMTEATPPSSPLLELLAAWKETFDERLVPRIDAEGEAQGRPPLEAASKGELEALWLTVAARRDPHDVPRLLDTAWPTAWKAALVRLEALEHFPPDPRLARGVRLHGARYEGHTARAVPRTANRIALAMHGSRKGDAPERLWRASPEKADLDALWNAVWNAPGEVAPRAVLADALQQAGDPRGEFIALQLSNEPSAAERANALSRLHADAWTKGLPVASRTSLEFRRGFIARAQVDANSASLDSPQWRTLEHLELKPVLPVAFPRVEAFLSRLPLLRTLTLHDPTANALLETLVGPWPSVTTLFVDHWSRSTLPRAFPALRSLSSARFEPHTLSLASEAGLRAVLLRDVDVPTALTAFDRSSLEELRIVVPGWALRVRRGEDWVTARRSGARRDAKAPLAPLLEGTSRACVRVVDAGANAVDAGKLTLTFDGEPFEPDAI